MGRNCEPNMQGLLRAMRAFRFNYASKYTRKIRPFLSSLIHKFSIPYWSLSDCSSANAIFSVIVSVM